MWAGKTYLTICFLEKFSAAEGRKSSAAIAMEVEMKKVWIAIFLAIALAQFSVAQIQTAKVTGGEVQG